MTVVLRPPEMRFDRRAVLRFPVLVGAGLFLALIAGFAIGTTGQRDGTASVRANPMGVPAHSHAGAGTPALPGTSVSAGGYTLAPSVTSFRAGVTQLFTFRIIRSTVQTGHRLHDRARETAAPHRGPP